MRFIRSIERIEPEKPNGATILYMMGYGGRIWHSRRQLRILQREGYRLVVLDFVLVFQRHNPQDLVDLMDEVDTLVEKEGLLHEDLLIVGVSLGGLVGYNLLRRHAELKKLLVITGGDISHVPIQMLLKKKWGLTREELAQKWKGVNMYAPPGTLKDKHVVMLLPKRDRVIDPNEVAGEIALQQQYNDITLVHTNGGHWRTIITHTIIAPRRPLRHIQRLRKL